MKLCTTCNTEKELNMFSLCCSKRDGRYFRCKSCQKKHAKIYYNDNKDTIKYRQATYDKEKVLEKARKSYKLRYSKGQRRHQYPYIKLRRETEPLFKMKLAIRALIGNCMRYGGNKKEKKSVEILGCSYAEFKTHIECKFKEGMHWSNHGLWEYDHILPIAAATNSEDLVKLNHYSNFQPLWKEENRKKRDKIVTFI